MSNHTDLIDKVNEAKTEYEHTYAKGVLAGWRLRVEQEGRRWNFMEADYYALEKYGERPICCGELLDWKAMA